MRAHDLAAVDADDEVEPGFYRELGVGVFEDVETKGRAGTGRFLAANWEEFAEPGHYGGRSGVGGVGGDTVVLESSGG